MGSSTTSFGDATTTATGAMASATTAAAMSMGGSSSCKISVRTALSLPHYSILQSKTEHRELDALELVYN